MSEFPHSDPSDTPSDDEFDVFLQDISARSDSATSKLESSEQMKTFDVRFDAMCIEEGYQTLDEENERSKALRLFIEDRIRQHTDFSRVEEGARGEYIELAVSEAFEMIRSKEHFSLLYVRLLAMGEEATQVIGKFDIAVATDRKARAYATLIIERHLDPNDPIIAILNRTVPGKNMSVDDPFLTDYFIKALENAANQPELEKQQNEEDNEIFNYLGIDLSNSSPEKAALLSAIPLMVHMSRIVTKGDNANANREERLRSVANSIGLNQELVSRILTYVNEKYPL